MLEEKFDNLSEITRKIVSSFIKSYHTEKISRLKKQLKNLTFLEPKYIDFIDEIQELKEEGYETKEIWDKTSSFIKKYHRKYKQKKPFMFEGKMREYELDLIEFMKKAGKAKGASEIMVKILGYLLFHKKLTQEELQELSGASRGSISMFLNKLEGFGAIDKKLIPGTRTYKYSFTGYGEGGLKAMADNIGYLKLKNYFEATDFFEKKIQRLEQPELITKRGASPLIERLKELADFFRFFQKIVKKISRSDLLTKNLQYEPK
jgi:DNA-binding MarR family transcriptional regulator